MRPVSFAGLYFIYMYILIKGYKSKLVNTICDSMDTCYDVPEFLNPRPCYCQLYGVSEYVCGDFQDTGATLNSTTVNFTDIINGNGIDTTNKTVLGKYLTFVAENAECDSVKKGATERKYTIIKTCPIEMNDKVLKQQCENPVSLLPPVDYIGRFNIGFQNIFCALCHGVSETFVRNNMTGWTTYFDCGINEESHRTLNLKGKLLNGSCVARYAKPESSYLCSYDNIEDVNLILQNRCQTCINETTANSLNCIICKSAVDVFALLRMGCFKPPEGKSIAYLFILPTEQEVEIITNGGIFKSSNLCKDNENYDILFQECRTFYCPKGKFPFRGKCQQDTNRFMSPESQLFPNGSSKISVHVYYNSHDTDPFPPLLENDELSTIIDLIRPPPSLGHLHRIESPSIEEWLKQQNEAFCTLLLKVSLEKLFFFWSFQTFNMPNDATFEVNMSNMNQTTITNMTCPVGDFECFKDLNSYFVNSKPYASVPINGSKAQLLYSLDNIFYNFTINRQTQNLDILQVCVCSPPPTDNNTNEFNCSFPIYEYTSEEFTILENGFLELIHNNVQFSSKHYFIKAGKAMVCYNPNKKVKFYQLNAAQNYLSYICSGISIVLLMISFIFYIMFKELRTLPGRLTLGLAISLILGQALMFLPDFNRDECKYLAAFTHFCWLSVFLWMSSIACNMLVTFHPKTMLVASGGWRSKMAVWRYSLLCLGIPLVICLTLLVLDMLPGNHYHIQYGLITCVWIADKYGYIFAFFLPVILTLLFNLMCFTMTLFYIEKSMKDSEAVTGRARDKSRCKIYLRLSSVMGFAWIFGFIATFADVPALWYVYIILNGLQGLFIFLSFSVNTRIRRLLTNRMSELNFTSIFTSTSTSHQGNSQL